MCGKTTFSWSIDVLEDHVQLEKVLANHLTERQVLRRHIITQTELESKAITRYLFFSGGGGYFGVFCPVPFLSYPFIPYSSLLPPREVTPKSS